MNKLSPKSRVFVEAVAGIYGWDDALSGMYQPDRSRLKNAAAQLNDDERAESAIPSYIHTNPLLRALFTVRGNILAQWISDYDPKSVLDVGCGAGIFLEAIYNSNIEHLVGVDLAPEAANEYLQGKSRGRVLRADIQELPFSNDCFEAIVAMDVLEHFDRLEPAVSELARVLKPGGILLISGPTESPVYKLGRLVAGFSGEYHPKSITDVEMAISHRFRPTGHQREISILGPLFRLSAHTNL